GVLDDAEHLANLDVLAIFPIDALQHTTLRRRHLEVDLIGLELHERIHASDDFSFVAQPLRDAGVHDRLSDLGNDYVGWHRLAFAARQLTVLLRLARNGAITAGVRAIAKGLIDERLLVECM